jgi:hypothetical protein
LFRGLQADRSATILIEGHTSSEGTEVHLVPGCLERVGDATTRCERSL